MPRRDADLAIYPNSPLARLLADSRVTRGLRRDILAVVQAPKTPRRDRLERSVEKRLTALGIKPS